MYTKFLAVCKITVDLRRKNSEFDYLKSRVDFSLPIHYDGNMSNFKRYYQDKNIVLLLLLPIIVNKF